MYKFNVSLVARGGAGAYRSILSVFSQTVLPSQFLIYCLEENEPLISSIMETVIDDLGEKHRKIHSEFKTRRSDFLEIDISENTVTSLLMERDMYLPNYIEEIIKLSKNMENSVTNQLSLALTACPYYQRKSLGNSKKVHPSQVDLIPLSSISLSNFTNQVQHFKLDEKKLQLRKNSSFYISPYFEPHVVVQSNVNSALGFEKT